MDTIYHPRSLAGATREVRRLRKQCQYLSGLVEAMAPELKALAKLSADEPQFFNPLDVCEAKRVRDRILSGKVLPT